MIDYKQLNYALVAMLCVACAPSGDENGQANTQTLQSNTEQSANEGDEITSTQQLVAQTDFNFKSDRMLSLSFEKFPSSYGTFVVYSDFERYDSKQDTYYPDYMTRIAIFIADTELIYNVVVPSDQAFLILEWLPMDGKSHETYQYLALTEKAEYVAKF